MDNISTDQITNSAINFAMNQLSDEEKDEYNRIGEHMSKSWYIMNMSDPQTLKMEDVASYLFEYKFDLPRPKKHLYLSF